MSRQIRRFFRPAQVNPVSLFDHTVSKNFIFQNAAIIDDGLCRSDVVFLAGHEHAANPEPTAFLQSQMDHGSGIALSPFGRTDPVADMTSGEQQIIIQMMTDADGAHEDISVFIKAKESGSEGF